MQDTKLIHRNPLNSLYTTMKDQKEIKETISFTIESKSIKYLGRNLSKKAKDLYSENYKILMKEIKDDTNRWKYIPYSWTGRINSVKMTILPGQCTDLKQSLSNYQWNLYRTRTKTKKFVQKHERHQISKAISRKKNNAGSIRLPGFILYYKVIVIKRVWYWHQKKENHQKYISMGQVRESRNKPIHLWLINLWTLRQEYTMVKR